MDREGEGLLPPQQEPRQTRGHLRKTCGYGFVYGLQKPLHKTLPAWTRRRELHGPRVPAGAGLGAVPGCTCLLLREGQRRVGGQGQEPTEQRQIWGTRLKPTAGPPAASAWRNGRGQWLLGPPVFPC